MQNTVSERNCRILIVDDSRAIHDDFRKILARKGGGHGDRSGGGELVGVPAEPSAAGFELDSAYQGDEALGMIRKAAAEQRPYALAFIDVRMPPGWDGIETAEKILPVDPDLQIVICTAYSDYSWSGMAARLGRSDRLVILKKPFDNIEVLQLAEAFTRKWELAAQNRQQLAALNKLVEATMRDLNTANQAAEAAEGSRTTFLTAASGELRSPTIDIIALSRLLMKTQLDPMQREYTERILSTAIAALDMLNNIAAATKAACVPRRLQADAPP